ncbi:substrate-binding domain-containing protein [candidate division KSB1 bacterium]|nr:substrate-binding domain-containing protein [candidate division KSB1 bacterium]
MELAKSYDVSLITIKKALAELIRDGFLYGRVGKGTFVAKIGARKREAGVGTIGLVLTDFNNPFFMQISHHLEEHSSTRGCKLLFSYSSNDFKREENQIHHFQEMGVKGLIIASTEHTNRVPQIVRELHETHFPYVMISYIEDPAIHYVGTDHERGAMMATECLIHSGCQRLGYINAEKNNPLGALRRQGFLLALREHGLDYIPEFEFAFPASREDYESGFAIGEDFYRLPDCPDGVFAFNDQSALGFERALKAGGLRIPGDVSLVGFDDVTFPIPPPVPLTTIHQPSDQIADKALEVLISQIENKPFVPRTILKPTIIHRESCCI